MTNSPNSNDWKRQLIDGVIAGEVGGVVMALIAFVLGALAKPILGIENNNILLQIAAIARSNSPIVGFGLHLVFSAVIGVGFGFTLGTTRNPLQHIVINGLLYGLVWWVLGTLTLLPLLSGGSVQYDKAFSASMLVSIFAHLSYGLVTSFSYQRIHNRHTTNSAVGSGKTALTKTHS